MKSTLRNMEAIGPAQPTLKKTKVPLLQAISAPAPPPTPSPAKAPRTGFALVARPGQDGATLILLSTGQRDSVRKNVSNAVRNSAIGDANAPHVFMSFTDHPAPAQVGPAIAKAIEAATATLTAQANERAKVQYVQELCTLDSAYVVAVDEGRDTLALFEAVIKPRRRVAPAHIVADDKSKLFTCVPTDQWAIDILLNVVMAAAKALQPKPAPATPKRAQPALKTSVTLKKPKMATSERNVPEVIKATEHQLYDD
ncbi:hypothetical protein SDRG_08522 [Saprolegnia diclina VS20]|uniref:Uncharacterized protein n=1 Tax=Saprolegnia diclina (strain VS20) TaxID=1156394 RepID=T0QGH2_SAPDV|nr:hypothetical protein SDRG_08522 [Saprolegnia diclina VS20]EQC33841.1 hypothetical protein SDRG_08522 [Saprolegnia diclina VS20]|eukprot:XP_008612636.1 hypothetical protein SDRG_08522 [Saprolegnia diclina VS20]